MKLSVTVPGRDACEMTLVHQEDAGINIEMVKLGFAKGVWSYVSKMNNALREYSSCSPIHLTPVSTLHRLIKKVSITITTLHRLLFLWYRGEKGKITHILTIKVGRLASIMDIVFCMI